jgi:predicted nucleotidyltransferase
MTAAIDKFDPEFRKDLKLAVEILKDAGCSEIYIFGSIMKHTADDNSDIDLAIKGCPRGMFFKLLGRLIFEL